MTALLSHLKLQLRLSLRDPAYIFTSILLPAGLYWFFAVPESGNAYMAKFLTGSFCAFAFFGVVFLQYAINASFDKESAWALYLSTLPIRPWVSVLARLATAVVLGCLACGLIYLVSLAATPTDLGLQDFFKMLFRLTLGSLPFLLMGLVIGHSFKPKPVVPVANFIHLVLSFAGGLWKPPEILPEALQSITPWLPTYHYGMLVWSLASPEIELGQSQLVYLGGFTAAMVALLFFKGRARLGSTRL